MPAMGSSADNWGWFEAAFAILATQLRLGKVREKCVVELVTVDHGTQDLLLKMQAGPGVCA